MKISNVHYTLYISIKLFSLHFNLISDSKNISDWTSQLSDPAVGLDSGLVCPSVCQSVFSPPVSPALYGQAHTHTHTPPQYQKDAHKHNTHNLSLTHAPRHTHLAHAMVCVTSAICLLIRAVFYTFVFPLLSPTSVYGSTAKVELKCDGHPCKNSESILNQSENKLF